jgi:CBS-domain-containing membrane protein
LIAVKPGAGRSANNGRADDAPPWPSVPPAAKGSIMFVSKHMSAPPITITPDTDFKAAMGLMQRHKIRRLPVVDADGELAGIVAERDLLVAADRFLASPVEVDRIMTRTVITVREATPVVEAATLMIRRKIGGLPVVDASRAVLGIVTETDLLRALAALLKQSQRAAPLRKKRRAKRPAAKTVAGRKK